MYDELTQVDIQKMRDEIDYRTRELRPKLIEEVKTARAFGDLSENFEYKAAKREKNRNDSRIRYLQRMVDTAKVITDHSTGDTVGDDAAAKRARGAHQQGIPRGQGRDGTSRGRDRARAGQRGRRLRHRHPLGRKGAGRRFPAHQRLLKPRRKAAAASKRCSRCFHNSKHPAAFRRPVSRSECRTPSDLFSRKNGTPSMLTFLPR